MQIDRIFFYGDSYCASSDEGSFPWILEQKGHQVMRLGKRGSGPVELFSFLQDHNALYDPLINDFAVIMYSAYDRQLDKSGFSMPNVNSIDDISDPFISKDYINALRNYYKHLFNEQQWMNIFKAHVLATRQQCADLGLPYIEYCCFKNEADLIGHKFNLHDWCQQGQDLSDDEDDFDKIKNYHNHMSPIQNQEFAEKIIIDLTEKYRGERS